MDTDKIPTPTLPPQPSSLNEAGRSLCNLHSTTRVLANGWKKTLKQQIDEKMDHLSIKSFLSGSIFS